MSDRKYRQRGYQDSDRDDRDRKRKSSGEGPKARIEGAPRGRGLGLPTEVVFKCAVCGAQVRTLSAIASDRTCDSCGNPLHTCTNCISFDPGARFQCRKPVEQRIDNKSKANECDLFQPKTIRDLRTQTPQSPGDARSAFDALFKK